MNDSKKEENEVRDGLMRGNSQCFRQPIQIGI